MTHPALAAWASPRRVLGALLAAATAVLLLVLPALVNSYQLFLACLVMTMATAGLGLVLIMGWSGQIVLAQAGFMGVGAYGTTSLVALGVPWPVAVVLAGLVAALVGVGTAAACRARRRCRRGVAGDQRDPGQAVGLRPLGVHRRAGRCRLRADPDLPDAAHLRPHAAHRAADRPLPRRRHLRRRALRRGGWS